MPEIDNNGKLIISLYDYTDRRTRARLRSATPRGFAKAFFQANP